MPIFDETDFENLADIIQSGAAVCLLGAGFSLLAKQADTVTGVPDTASLTDEIKKMMGVDAGEFLSLSDAAEICEENVAEKLKLNALLIRRLTSTQPSNDQKWLANQSWRAIFTTNFDDVVEVSRGTKNFTPVTPVSNLSTVTPGALPIYYLHGRALDLREQDNNPSFVISESNYLQLGIKNKALYARLFNEIVCARAVVLIGYSLRDLDIAKEFPNQSGVLRGKTFIVTREGEGSLASRRLQKFGTVLPIGLHGFRERLEKCSTRSSANAAYQYLRKFDLDASFDDSAGEISGDDFLKSIISGRIIPEKFAAQAHSSETPYCVTRGKALEAVVNGSQQRFIVSSDFGNGKTSFLTQLAVRLFTTGRKVFFIETKLTDIFTDIDTALSKGDAVAFIIDDVVRYRNIAAYIGPRLHNQAILVCTTRGDQDAQYEEIAGQIGGAHRLIDLNSLSDEEVTDWDLLLERWGYWELKSALSEKERREFIVEKCGRENRSIILSLFEDSKVARRIDEIVNFFLKKNDRHIRSFCGLLISSLAQRHVSWESMVTWLDINEGELRKDLHSDDISFLFTGGRDWNFLTSSQLSEYILKNKFVETERDILVDVYSQIVLKTAESASDSTFGFDFRENLKELVKFRFLEKLFGETDASGVLIGRVYKKLSQAQRIRGNPQFWLQYAMSRIKVGDLPNAESFINTALGISEKFGVDYNPFQIKDQRARLYFLKNTKSLYVSRNEIKLAVDDLIELAKNQGFDVVYTMRSLPIILDFLEERIDDVELDIREKIVSFIILLKEKTSGFERLPRSQRGETKVLRRALLDIELILFNA